MPSTRSLRYVTSVLARSGDCHDDVIAAAARTGGRILLDAAEQDQLVAGEGRGHHDAVVGQRRDQPLGAKPDARKPPHAPRTAASASGGDDTPHHWPSRVRTE